MIPSARRTVPLVVIIIFIFLQYFKKWGQTYGRTGEYLCENNDHYRPGLSQWVGRVNQQDRCVCVQLMIRSTRPTVPPVAITNFSWKLFCFARLWKVGTDEWTDRQTPSVKIVITTSRDCGPASWINSTFYYDNYDPRPSTNQSTSL